jgi:hypothetical protein
MRLLSQRGHGHALVSTGVLHCYIKWTAWLTDGNRYD